MSSFLRAARWLLVLVLACAVMALPSLAAVTADAAVASAPRVSTRAVISFEKNWANPFASKITFRVWRKPAKATAKSWVLVEQTSWRAGSGLGGRAGKDSCHRNVGWLPDGAYSFVQRDHRDGPAIEGRVFELASKACRNGTRRQLLFIHSEQTRANTQCPNLRGDDRCRWEPVYNDYRSNGCIKMAPADLAALTRRFHRYFRAERRYPTGVVRLVVS